MRVSIIAGSLAVVIAVYSGIAFAADCPSVPASATVPVDELIDRSSRIVLASVPESSAAPKTQVQPETITLDLEAERRKVTEGKSQADNRIKTDIGIATLSVQEQLKGSGERTLYRPNFDSNIRQHDFDAHRDPAFWEDNALGLASFDSDCRQTMTFEPGKTYLVFEGPAHVKSAELIESEDDEWLAYVRERLR